jgi:hypothetical protein
MASWLVRTLLVTPLRRPLRGHAGLVVAARHPHITRSAGMSKVRITSGHEDSVADVL